MIAEVARNYPLPRTSQNATPVVDILKAFSLNCLIGGRRFAGFCASKAAVSQSSARLLLLVYNLWSLFVRVVKNQSGHTEAIILTADSRFMGVASARRQ